MTHLFGEAYIGYKTMTLWKPKKKLSQDDVALVLLMFSHDLIMGAKQELETHLGSQERFKWDRVADELIFFCFFALDYWISDHTIARNVRQEVRKSLSYHWQQMLGCDDEGQTIWNTLQERLREYGPVVNQELSDQDKFLGLGIKLSEFCSFPRNPHLLILATDFFIAAMNAVNKIEWYKVDINTDG